MAAQATFTHSGERVRRSMCFCLCHQVFYPQLAWSFADSLFDFLHSRVHLPSLNQQSLLIALALSIFIFPRHANLAT